MKIQILNLTEKTLDAVSSSCKHCVYWQHPEIANCKENNNLLTIKKEWLKNVRNEFGDCGRLLSVDDKIIGYATYAPPRYFPNLINYPVIPEPDVIIIACLFIFKKRNRETGFGSVLLNSVLENLEERNITAVQVIARKNSEDNPAGPVEFYLKNGFVIQHDHPEFPILKMNLN